MMSNVCIHHKNIKKMDDSIESKSKPLHSTNIWINNINNEVNDPRYNPCHKHDHDQY
jgi:hypothetical protein